MQIHPCWFCKSEEVEAVGDSMDLRDWMNSQVFCYSCGAMGPSSEEYYETDEKAAAAAIELWNKVEETWKNGMG